MNGQRNKHWRDIRATVEVICQKYVESKDFSGKHVKIKQPLSLMRLLLAVIEQSGDFGTLKTKGTVCKNH